MGEKLFTTAPVTRVRVEAAPESEVAAELPKGTEVEVHARGETFIQVSGWHPEQGRVSGWVHKSFVGLSADLPKEKPLPELVVPRCNACGAGDWVVVNYGHVGTHSMTPYIKLGFLESIYVKARVCRTCGQVQMCLDQKGMDQLNEWMKSKDGK